jgi:ATP-dependent RNA helicase DeaD
LAYLRLSRGKQSAPEEIEAVNVDAPAKRERRDEFAQSVWMSLSVGRNDRAEPRWILPLVCRCGDITKADIGAIKLQQDETFVQLNATVADKFFGNLKDGVLEDNVKATRLDRAPKIAAGKSGSSYPNKPGRGGPRKDFGDKPRGPRKDFGDKPRGPRKDFGDKPRGDRDFGDKPRGPKKEWGDKPAGKKDWGDKPKKDYGDKPKSATRYDDRGPKPGTKTDAISKPRHKAAPSSDFKPKFGGKADAMPSRGGKPGGKPSGKPAGKPAGKGPNKWADPSAGRKPRTKKK